MNERETSDILSNEVRKFLKERDIGHFQAILILFCVSDFMLRFIHSMDEGIIEDFHNSIVDPDTKKQMVHYFMFASDLSDAIHKAQEQVK